MAIEGACDAMMWRQDSNRASSPIWSESRSKSTTSHSPAANMRLISVNSACMRTWKSLPKAEERIGCKVRSSENRQTRIIERHPYVRQLKPVTRGPNCHRGGSRRITDTLLRTSTQVPFKVTRKRARAGPQENAFNLHECASVI